MPSFSTAQRNWAIDLCPASSILSGLLIVAHHPGNRFCGDLAAGMGSGRLGRFKGAGSLCGQLPAPSPEARLNDLLLNLPLPLNLANWLYDNPNH
jgi:hypothetical protein